MRTLTASAARPFCHKLQFPDAMQHGSVASQSRDRVRRLSAIDARTGLIRIGTPDQQRNIAMLHGIRGFEKLCKTLPVSTIDRMELWFVPCGGTLGLFSGSGMIVGFRDVWLRAFFVDDTRCRNIPSELENRLFRKLQLIDDATTDQDLRVPPSNRFEKLSGHLDGFHSIRVNKQWRLVFQWNSDRGEASDLYLDDHSYR